MEEDNEKRLGQNKNGHDEQYQYGFYIPLMVSVQDFAFRG